MFWRVIKWTTRLVPVLLLAFAVGFYRDHAELYRALEARCTTTPTTPISLRAAARATEALLEHTQTPLDFAAKGAGDALTPWNQGRIAKLGKIHQEAKELATLVEGVYTYPWGTVTWTRVKGTFLVFANINNYHHWFKAERDGLSRPLVQDKLLDHFLHVLSEGVDTIVGNLEGNVYAGQDVAIVETLMRIQDQVHVLAHQTGQSSCTLTM